MQPEPETKDRDDETNGRPRFRLRWDEDGIEFKIEGSYVSGLTRWLRWLALVAVVTGTMIAALKGIL